MNHSEVLVMDVQVDPVKNILFFLMMGAVYGLMLLVDGVLPDGLWLKLLVHTALLALYGGGSFLLLRGRYSTINN